PAHVGDGRTEWRRYHRQCRDIDATTLVGGIFQSYQRKDSVDRMEREFFLISARNLENLESLIRSQRSPNRVLLLGGALVRIRFPRGAHSEIALHDIHIAEANPRSPAGLARASGRRRVARKNP